MVNVTWVHLISYKQPCETCAIVSILQMRELSLREVKEVADLGFLTWIFLTFEHSQLQLFCTAFYVTSPLELTSEGSELEVSPG